jgi:hypothetical protein
VVTGAMVATVVFTIAYSTNNIAKAGDKALIWSWCGYASAASHLGFVVLHNTKGKPISAFANFKFVFPKDIPIDFYLPIHGSHLGSHMIGFGFPWYPTFETAFFLIAVVFFAVRTNFKKYVSVFFFLHMSC